MGQSEAKDKVQDLTPEQWVGQILTVKERLDTLPFGHHESAAIKDCLCALIDTLLGRRVLSTEVEQSGLVPVSGQLTNKGIEIAPGVVVELPDEPIPREIDSPFEVGSPVHEPLKGSQMATGVADELPTPLPGSIAANAVGMPIPQRRQVASGKDLKDAGLPEPDVSRAETKTEDK